MCLHFPFYGTLHVHQKNLTVKKTDKDMKKRDYTTKDVRINMIKIYLKIEYFEGESIIFKSERSVHCDKIAARHPSCGLSLTSQYVHVSGCNRLNLHDSRLCSLGCKKESVDICI